MAVAEQPSEVTLAPETLTPNPQTYLEQDDLMQTHELRDERGRATRWVALALGAAVVGGGAYVAAGPVARASAFAYALQNMGTEQSVDGKNSTIEAEFALGENLELTCASLNMWHVTTDTRVRVNTDVTFGSKTVTPPEMYSDFTFYREPDETTKKNDPNAGKTVGAVITCNDESKGDPVTVAFEAPTDPGAKYGESVVTLNTANMSTIATLPQVFVDRHDGALKKALNSGLEGGSAAFTVACLPLKVTNRDLDCGKIADKFTPGLIKKSQTMGQKAAERAVLEAIAQQGSQAAWEKQTLPQFLDYIAGQALKKGGVEALESVRVKIEGGAPDFNETDMFKEYGTDALAKDGIGIKLDTKNTKVNVTVNESYQPENYASIHKNTDGTYGYDSIPEGAS